MGVFLDQAVLVLELAPDDTLAAWTEDYLNRAPAFFSPDADPSQVMADSLLGNLLENENRQRGNAATARKVFAVVNDAIGTGYASYEDYLASILDNGF